MFVRKRKNKSGSTSVVVIDKSSGKPKELVCVGVSSDDEEIKALVIKGKEWIMRYDGQTVMDLDGVATASAKVDEMLDNNESAMINGTQLILDKVYEAIGFNAIPDDVLRHLVIARICQPGSKKATSAYLKAYYKEDLNHWRIYRYMDKLYNTQQEAVQRISVDHTMKVLGGSIGLMFYDVTSLYFETPARDGLRQPGFSKDGKTSESQIILGLLVSAGGYPLSYAVFNGSQYEGRTMIPIVDDFKQRFNLGDFVVVADSGLMSKNNVQLLNAAGYRYIIGARIRNESDAVRDWILSLDKKDGALYERPYNGNERLVVGYSAKRAAKEAYNRDTGVEGLRKRYASGSLTKDKLNKHGYNKFLEISKDVQVVICQDKIDLDARWDGLKGYRTNTDFPVQTVVDQYHALWVVERAFRVSKGNLEMRPIFHFTERRIEAHVCICFVAYKVYKELERIVREIGLDMSIDQVLEIAKTLITLQVKIPGTEHLRTRTLFLTPEHRSILPLFDRLGIETHFG
jgi:transposase